MKKKIQKPFDLEEWKNGAKVETRDGHQVRILCTDVKNDCRIVGVIIRNLTYEAIRAWYEDGHFFSTKDDEDDLVIVEEVEEPKRWADDEEARGEAWYIGSYSEIQNEVLPLNVTCNYNAFATEKQAKSALAMARISQLLAHDERYGGAITNEEWRDDNKSKYYIYRNGDDILIDYAFSIYHFLAFHESWQCDLFLAENKQLIKDFLMID